MYALVEVLDIILTVYMWIIIIRAVISWVNPSPHNSFVRFLYSITEPVLAPIRRRVPLVAGGIDFSPVIVILAIVLLKSLLFPVLLHSAHRY